MSKKNAFEFAIVQSQREDISSADVIAKLFEQGIQSHSFIITRADSISIASIFRQLIVERGISENINYNITCDSIFHSGISINEKEKIVLEMIGKLNGASRLFVTDPYIFGNSGDNYVNLILKLIKAISSNLKEIVFFYHKKHCATNTKKIIESEVNRNFSNIKIISIETESFHDRFWIDPDTGKGIVIGTSLNGIAKKICLIDYLSTNDVREIAALADQILVPPSP